MKNRILTLFSLLLFMAFSVNAQNYNELPESYQENVSRKSFRQAEKQVNSRDGDFGLSPIDMIYYDESNVPQGRSFGLMSVTSWGLDYLMPSSIRERVVNDCGNYPFIVGTVDSGTDMDHSELRGDHWLPSSNYTGQDAKHWHGTHVSGIMYQMLWEVIQTHENGMMKDIQILNGQGSGSFSGAVNMVASETAFFAPYIEREVGIFLNNSWGYNGPPLQALEDELQKSRDAGVCWIGSAGNAGREIEGYPGMSEYFSSVASVDPNGYRSSYSTINEWVDVAAPGSNINSTLPGNKQGKASGTSMSSPFVTALAALAYGKYGPILMGENMNIYLNHICTDVSPQGFDKQTGWGIPFVVKMLDTDPCSLDIFDCDVVDDPDDPTDEPDNPNDPTDPDEPVVTNAITFNSTGGHIMRYRRESQQGWEILFVSDIQVSAEANLPATELQESVDIFIDKYFNNRGIVLTDDMEYNDAIWWTGQFLEYVGRNEGVPLQVQYVVGSDEYGHTARETGFDKAFENATEVAWEEVDLTLPKDYFNEEPDLPIYRWLVKAEWSVDNSIGGGGLPKYNFDDSVGLYYTYVNSNREPTERTINMTPPFEGATVKNILAIRKR